MDEELFGEGSSSEEEEPQQQEEQDEAAAESGDDSSGSEKEETAAAGSDSEPESKASSVGGEEEKSEEESGNEQEGSDEEGVAQGTEEQQEAHDGSDDDSSAAGDEAAATAASSGDEQAGSEAGSVGGQTPVQSDSDEDQAANPETAEAEKSESEEEQSDGEDNKETKDSDEEGEDNKEKTTAESSDSGSEIGGKRPKVQDSDSSEEDNATEKTEKSDLFGDADDISSSDEEKMETQEKQQQQEVEEEGEETRRAMVYSEDEDQEEVKQQAMEEEQRDETRIEVEIPKINTNLGSSIHFVRFPNFVSVETRPFDPAVYEDEIEDDELLDEEGRTRMKLKVENTIRWKKYVDENGMQLTESNARLVRWSDGSMSMHLGSEIFDVHVMPLQGDHNHLFIRQGTGLQGQAVFKTKLTFRPHSTKSATHRKMTSRLAMRLNQNQQKVRVLPIAGQDPESRKAKLMKEEEDQLRAHMRREAQKRRMREKAHARGLNTNYLDDRLEEEDDSGAISVSAIKNKFKPGFGGVGRGIYSSDSDSGDEKQLTNAKRLESDDSDDDLGKKKKTDDGEKKKKYVVSDSESENEDNKETTAGTSENPTADESMEQASDSDE